MATKHSGLVLVVTLVAALSARPTAAELSFSSLARLTLLAVTSSEVPSFADPQQFDGEGNYIFGGDCNNFRKHSYALVAALGANEHYPSVVGTELTPAEAEPYFRAMLKAGLAAQGLKDGPNVVPPNPECAGSSGPQVESLALNAAFALKRWGGNWDNDIEQMLQNLLENGNWDDGGGGTLSNKAAWKPVAELLTAEVVCDGTMWAAAAAEIQEIYDVVIDRGAGELHSTHYGPYSLNYLVYLAESDSLVVTIQAHYLLGMLLTGEAHLYQPGGILSFPLSRAAGDSGLSYGPAWDRDMVPLLAILFEDDSTGIDFTDVHTITAGVVAAGYEAPSIARSIALDKSNGGIGVEYRSRFYRHASGNRSPQAAYHNKAVPVGAYALEDGKASLGYALGHQMKGKARLTGLALACPGCLENSVFVRHMAPMTMGEWDEWGEVGNFATAQCQGGSDILGCESYDLEVYPFHNALAILFNNRSDRPSYVDPVGVPHVTRQDPYSRAVFPDFSHADIGGTNGSSVTPLSNAWRTGQIGNVYVGWYPIGTLVTEEPMAGRFAQGQEPDKADYYRYYEFGESVTGSVIEIATTSDYSSLAEFETELASRQTPSVSGGAQPSITFQARDASDALCTLRLTMGTEYTTDPEKREIDCSGSGFKYDPDWVELDGNGQIVTDVNDMDFGPMSSPWVTWVGGPSGELVISRSGHQTEHYYLEGVNTVDTFTTGVCGP